MGVPARYIAAAALLLAVTAAAFLVARALTERDARRNSERRAQVAAAQIHDRIEQAVSLAAGLGQFMDDEGRSGVTNRQFATNASRWLAPVGLPAAWAEEVDAAHREAYERRIGRPIVSPDRRHAPAPPGRSYLPTTLVSGSAPLDVQGVDLSRVPGIAGALHQTIGPSSVASTPFARARGTPAGVFLAAAAANLAGGRRRSGWVLVFVSEATLRGAANNLPGLRLVSVTGPSPNGGGGHDVRQGFIAAGRQFAVVVPKEAVGGLGAALPWMILSAGLVVSLLVAGLGVYAGRRAKAQAELDSIFTLSSDLIAVADFNGYFTRVNPAVEEMLGYTQDEFIAKPYIEHVHPDDRESTAAAAEGIAGGERTSFENRYLHKDGSERVLEWTSTSVTEDGLAYAVGRDVTERRKTEQEVARLAAEQAALRRVATLVAKGVSPDVIFSAVSEEIGHLFGTNTAGVVRYDHDGPAIVFVGVSKNVEDAIPIGTRWALDDAVVSGSPSAEVYRTGRPARVDAIDWAAVGGPVAPAGRSLAHASTVASPIFVEGRLWGTATVSASEPLPPDADERLEKFTELLASAISNAEGKAELAASRRRIVAASDDARRRIERDLHDGVQQQLVSLSLKLRKEATDAPAGNELKERLASTSDDVGTILDALVDIARGIHPAILSQGGLAEALNVLAARCSVDVELNATIESPVPDEVEVAVYYVVSEALTNVAKYASASKAKVEVATEGGTLRVAVRDDGVGGAELGGGSGLIGLQDRVEALGGRIAVDSPPGRGTYLVVTLPIDAGSNEEIDALQVP